MDLKTTKNNKLLETAKEMRRNLTKQERRLWYGYLRYYPIKIYKQRIIGSFIADFYCHQARLVIEVDGTQHYSEEGRMRDEERTRILGQYGLSVIRITNKDVDRNFVGVCQMIDKEIQERILQMRE